MNYVDPLGGVLMSLSKEQAWGPGSSVDAFNMQITK